MMRFWLFIFLVLILVITGAIITYLFLNPYTGSMINAEGFMEKELTRISRNLTGSLGSASSQLVRLSGSLSRNIEARLRAGGINISDLKSHPAALEGLIENELERLLLAMERTKCSGVFMVLNATVNPGIPNAENSRAGISVRITEPELSGPEMVPRYIRGFSGIAYRNDFSKLAEWSMEFDVKDRSFFHLPIEKNNETKLPLSRLYYWNLDSVIGGGEAMIMCSVPLVDSEGNAFGVCGFEISAINFATNYSPETNGYGDVFCMFSRAGNNDLDTEKALFSGRYSSSGVASGKMRLDISHGAGLNIYKPYPAGGRELTGLHQDIRLYAEDSVFADGHFTVSLLMPKEDLDAFRLKMNIRFIGICAALLVLGLFFSMFVIRGYFKPMAKRQEEANAASEAKSAFLARMSHEIRTPMNAIIGIAQIGLQKSNLPEEYRTDMEKIYNSGSNLLGIINDILDMSKIETGKLELNPIEYDVPSLINDAVQLNIVRIGSKPIKFALDADENLPSKLYGDELRLKQILNNLLSNAIKYTQKGAVKLSVSHYIKAEDIILRFIVEDSGQGIKAEDRERLFSEYVRFNTEANRATEGTGLGLNITKRIIEMMDGTINVESEYGKGSAFTVEVKQKAVTCGVIGAKIAEKLRDFTFTGGRQADNLQITRETMSYGSVLVVDDVETNLYVAEGLLSPYMLKIETAISGFAAIEKIKNGKSYDIIFMDHMMPQMDGIETTQKLRALGYSGVIVALTANALVGNDEMFIKNGFDGYIPKPINAKELDTVLNKYIRNRHPEEAVKYKPEIRNEDLLKIFRRDAEKAIVMLRETSTDGNIKLFTTAVHAMKSALANIGENKASASASALEKAGHNNDREFIAANTEKFIETLEALTTSLIPAETANTETADITEDTAYLTEQLQIIKAACESYDDTTAFAVLDKLKEKLWKPVTAAALEKIHNALFLDSDFEAAAGIAEEYAATPCTKIPLGTK